MPPPHCELMRWRTGSGWTETGPERLFALATQAASWFLSTGDKPTHDAYHHVTSTLLRA